MFVKQYTNYMVLDDGKADSFGLLILKVITI